MTTRVQSFRQPYRPAECVSIDRRTRWGNPFRIDAAHDRATVIAQYRDYLRRRPDLVAAARRELKGKVLLCWCAPLACHGDVLAAVAEGAEP